MKHQKCICQQCGHELTMPRAGMSLQEARSWFRYARCPVCKLQLHVAAQAPKPGVQAYTQPRLWTEDPGEHGSHEHAAQSRGSTPEATGAEESHAAR
jgi:hypothetical protein